MNIEKFTDVGAERALLSCIIKNGKDYYIDATTYVTAEDFYLPINRAIFTSIGQLVEDPSVFALDTETIKLKAKSLGIDGYFKGKKEQEYIELLNESYFDKGNLKAFALQVRKYSILRQIRSRYGKAIEYIDNIKGTENLADILQNAEQEIVDYNLELGQSDKITKLSEGIDEYIDRVLTEPVIDQIGIPTGFTQWDEAIGGGLRKGTINIIAARAKKGKSWVALNMAINISSKNIPVLYLDTELTEEYQKSRMMGIVSQCPIRLLETRKVQNHPELVQKLIDSGKEIKDMPFFYKNISGMNHREALAFVRRWIVKEVGFGEDGFAKDCVVVYDYMKLTSGDELTKHTPEYIVLGLMLTEMHDFAVKYRIPILGFAQLNRQGIDSDDTSIIAGSDRMLWLCSSMSVLRDKDVTDIEAGSKWEYGNKKLSVLETRMGAGLATASDYINLHASLRPNVRDDEATGLITEGFKHSEVFLGYNNEPQNDKSVSDTRDKVASQ